MLRLGILFLLVCAPARSDTKIILYFSRAGAVRDVFAADQPVLQDVLRNGAAAVMTIGPAGGDPLATIREGRYVAAGEPVADEGFPPGVLPIFEPLESPAAGDARLAAARRRYPKATVIALHAGPMVPEGTDGIAASLTVPSWVAVCPGVGRLYSETTRRAGVVSNLDVRPTIERILTGRTPVGLPGSPMWGEQRRATWYLHGVPTQLAHAIGDQNALLTTARATVPVSFGIGFGFVALLFLAAWRVIAAPARGCRPLQYGLVALLTAPAAVAIAAARTPTSLPVFLLLTVVATAAFTALVVAAGRLVAFARADVTPATLQLAAGGVTAYLLVGTWRGSLTMALSPITNLYLTGVRFYGLGNEYAALFLACGVLAGLVTVQRSGVPRMSGGALFAFGLWLLALCFVAGWPGAGANMGGMLTGCITGGIAWYLAARRSGARHAWIWPAAATLALFALIVWTDAHSAHATHVGRFVRAAADHPQTPLAILANKVAIQWGLLTAPPAFALYAAALAMLYLARGPLAPARQRLQRRYPWAALSLPTLLIGGGFGMLLNDTGIVMWGLMAAVALGAAALLALEPAEMTMMNA